MSVIEAATPERSLSQRFAALDHANEIRLARAEIKRQVRARRLDPVDLVENPPDCLLSMHAFELLVAIPRWGQVKAGKMLNRVEISPRKTLGGLTRRQREQLALTIRAYR